MQKRISINNQIRAKEVRVVDDDGKQLGVFALAQALKMAQNKGLDLIKVTDNIEPPVCRIADYGKYLYQQKKKEKQQKTKADEMKNVRLTFNISDHDMETRMKASQEFLNQGHKVRIEMVLRGRQKALADFAKEKLNKFLEKLKETTGLKIARELKREGRGLTIIITKQ